MAARRLDYSQTNRTSYALYRMVTLQTFAHLNTSQYFASVVDSDIIGLTGIVKINQ